MANLSQEDDNQFKVRLTASTSSDRLTDKRRSVVFDVAPDLIENRNVNYKTLDPIHAPGQMYVYNNTSSRTFNLSNVKLISRTRQEASINLARLWTLRGWCMPAFGQPFDKIKAEDYAAQRTKNNIDDLIKFSLHPNSSYFLGRPPQVLLLSAYSRLGATMGTRGIGHLRRIPVVIQQLSIPYPSDVDYIPTDDDQPTPMPTILTIDLTLSETHSPTEYENFSLQDFREGNLPGF